MFSCIRLAVFNVKFVNCDRDREWHEVELSVPETVPMRMMGNTRAWNWEEGSVIHARYLT